jgi:hypothetical protein
MSKKGEEAHQRAFQRGQDDWRGNKGLDRDNPYPTQSPDHDYWRQGWEAERDIQHK